MSRLISELAHGYSEPFLHGLAFSVFTGFGYIIFQSQNLYPYRYSELFIQSISLQSAGGSFGSADPRS